MITYQQLQAASQMSRQELAQNPELAKVLLGNVDVNSKIYSDADIQRYQQIGFSQFSGQVGQSYGSTLDKYIQSLSDPSPGLVVPGTGQYLSGAQAKAALPGLIQNELNQAVNQYKSAGIDPSTIPWLNQKFESAGVATPWPTNNSAAGYVQPTRSYDNGGVVSGGEGKSGDTTAAAAVLDGMKNAGLTINPNVPITPAAAAEFMSFAAQNANVFLPYAKSEIAPYFVTQLKLASDSLQRSLGYNQDQLAQNEKDTQTKYADTLKNIGVQSADQGFAQSGIRNLQESNLARDTQSTLDQGRKALAFNEGNQVGQFAQTYGSSNLPSVAGSPAPRVLAGQSQFDTSGSSSPFYQLSPDVYSSLTGSNQFAETSAENTRASDLESLYNTNNARSLTLPA